MTITQGPGSGFVAEGNGWMTRYEPQAALASLPSGELLSLTSALPGNARYARLSGPSFKAFVDRGETILIREARVLIDGILDKEALSRLSSPLPPPSLAELPDDDSVEAALEASGHACVRRDDSWAVPAFAGLPRELIIRRVPGGVSVTATLIEWEPDVLEPVAGEALAEFMLQAQIGLRFARCELDPRSARVVSRTVTESLETDLVHCLLGVIAGCRILAREARALLLPDVARAYLDIRRDSYPRREGDAGNRAGCRRPGAVGLGRLTKDF